MNADADGTSKGLNQLQGGREVPDRRGAVADLDQRDDRQHQQHGELDARGAPSGSWPTPRSRRSRWPSWRRSRGCRPAGPSHCSASMPIAVGVEEEEQVLTGDLGQAGHDQDVSGDDGPTAPHPVLGPKARAPQVKVVPQSGIGVVHLLVPVGDEQHGDEGDDGDDRRLKTDGGDHESKGGGQAVGRCGGGDADDRARDQVRAPPI